MSYPNANEIETALLLRLYLDGGSDYQMKSSDTYQPLADQFGLSVADRVRGRTDGRSEPEWHNKIQWARNELRKANYLDESAPRGIWKLSPTGIQAAQQYMKHLITRSGALQDRIPGPEAINNDEHDALVESLPDIEELNLPVVEGKKQLITHFRRERNQAIVAAKKKQVLTNHQTLQCEACGFDFQQTYGKRGYGFCEAHHTKPLGAEEGETQTSLSDLAILCSNCHRMIHREPMLTVEELRQLIAEVSTSKTESR